MRKRIMCLLMTMMLMFSVCACKSAETTEETKEDEIKTVTIGTTPWTSSMFFYLAMEQGFDEANNVKIEIQEFASTTETMNAFVSGKLDFLVIDSPEAISPYGQYKNFYNVLLMDKSNGAEGLVTTSDIKTPADLKGKTIATQLYSVDHMLLLTLLSDNGMTADDVNIVDMTIEEAGNAFIAGQCDAACIWDPFYTSAIDAGGNVLFSSADNPDLITDILLANKDLCDSDPETVKAVVKSYYDAVDYWKANPDDANAYMGEKLGVSAEEFEALIAGLSIPTIEECSVAFTEDEDYSYWGYTQNVIRDFMYELEVFDKNDFDCSEAINRTFIDELMK